ncbi:hypothetical protein PFISCL1PPCAC_14128, partial [Pristionchus fissidentatus]
QVGGCIDIVSLLNSHLLSTLPSKGYFLDFFLPSTTPGRVFLFVAWGLRACQGITNFLMAANRSTAVLLPVRHRRARKSLISEKIQTFYIRFGLVMVFSIVFLKKNSYFYKFVQFYETAAVHFFFLFAFILISFFSLIIVVLYIALLYNFRS